MRVSHWFSVDAVDPTLCKSDLFFSVTVNPIGSWSHELKEGSDVYRPFGDFDVTYFQRLM